MNTGEHFKSLVWGVVLVLLAFFTLFGKKRRKIKHSWPKVPDTIPFLGNISYGNVTNIVNVFENWASLYGAKSGIFECKMVTQKLFVLCNDERMSELESYRPFDVTRRDKVSNIMKSLGADGLFAAEGDIWRADRKLFGPAMNRKNIRDYVASIKLVASRLTHKWEQAMENHEVITINSDLTSYTMDIISLVAFSQDLDSLNQGDPKLIQDTKALLAKIVTRVFSPFPYWKIPLIGQYLDGAGFALQRVKQRYHEIIKEHKSAISISKTGVEKKDKSLNSSDKSKSFLGKIVLLGEKENSTWSEHRLKGNLNTMFVAGSETSFNTLCSCIYHICNDQTGLQDELATEALAIKDFESAAGLEELTESLPRMRSFLYEILRLKGPVPLMGMQSQKSIMIDGVELPPKTNFILLYRQASLMESSNESRRVPTGPMHAPAKEFCARRWLVSKAEGRGMEQKLEAIKPTFKTGFRAFGYGMRVCPGRDLAEIETLIALSYILRNFEIALEDGHPEVKFIFRVTETPDIDIRLVLKPRKVD